MTAERVRTLLVSFVLLAGLVGGPATATNPLPARVGQIQGYLDFGTSLNTTYYGYCYTSGPDYPQLLGSWGGSGSWMFESWGMTDLWDYASLELCGFYSGTKVADQPVGPDCFYQGAEKGTGTLVMDGSKSTPTQYTVSRAGWKAGSNATIVLTADLHTSGGQPAGQLVALLQAPFALCPSYSSSMIGVWTIVPPVPTE